MNTSCNMYLGRYCILQMAALRDEGYRVPSTSHDPRSYFTQHTHTSVALRSCFQVNRQLGVRVICLSLSHPLSHTSHLSITISFDISLYIESMCVFRCVKMDKWWSNRPSRRKHDFLAFVDAEPESFPDDHDAARRAATVKFGIADDEYEWLCQNIENIREVYVCVCVCMCVLFVWIYLTQTTNSWEDREEHIRGQSQRKIE